MPNDEEKSLPLRTGVRQEVWRIIFQHDTKWAKGFDIILLWLIAASVLVIMLWVYYTSAIFLFGAVFTFNRAKMLNRLDCS